MPTTITAIVFVLWAQWDTTAGVQWEPDRVFRTLRECEAKKTEIVRSWKQAGATEPVKCIAYHMAAHERAAAITSEMFDPKPTIPKDKAP